MKKCVKLLVSLLFFVIISVNAKDLVKAETVEWMGEIDDAVSIGEMSIPGTHDSCALYESISGTAKCQSLTLEQQLSVGVRYVDIRCRRYDNKFVIHHGVQYQHMNFDDVLSICYAFLDAHPSETLIMSVKEEYNAYSSEKSFDEIFEEYISSDKERWYLSNSIPQLGEVRGKIVLLRRFAGSEQGLAAYDGWQTNTSFDIQNDEYVISVQDCYKVSDNDSKWQAILAQYDKCAQTDGKKTLSLNYTSGYYPNLLGIPNIRKVSGDINARLSSYLETEQACGVTIMDFVTAELCQKVIRMN